MINDWKQIQKEQMQKVVAHNRELQKEIDRLKNNEDNKKRNYQYTEMKELFDIQDKISKVVLEDPLLHLGLIEEALQFFLLDGIGNVDKLKAIYDDTKRK